MLLALIISQGSGINAQIPVLQQTRSLMGFIRDVYPVASVIRQPKLNLLLKHISDVRTSPCWPPRPRSGKSPPIGRLPYGLGSSQLRDSLPHLPHRHPLTTIPAHYIDVSKVAAYPFFPTVFRA